MRLQGNKDAMENTTRTERIIKWLEENHKKIDAMMKGKLTFDFAGSDLTWHLIEGPEEIKGEL